MDFLKFADLMEKIGFRDDEPIAPIFTLSKTDLKNSVFKRGYSKAAGHYRVISIWLQDEEVALWVREKEDGTKLFPFHKEEVDYLAKKNKFRKTEAI